VEVLHHEEDLPNELACVLGTEGYDFCDHVEEVLALDELQDEIDEVAVFD
jgi:maltooligosyltrehalose synthase